MPELTRQEIIDAHDALDALSKHSLVSHNVKMAIRNALPPKPRLTMAEVGWDEDKHFLAEAEHPSYGSAVLLQDIGDDMIQCVVNDREKNRLFRAFAYNLTLTGKRYTLTEVQ